MRLSRHLLNWFDGEDFLGQARAIAIVILVAVLVFCGVWYIFGG